MLGEDAAEQVAQRTCLQAWQHLASLQPGSVFAIWLYRLGIDCCIEELRRTNRFQPLPPDSPDPLETVDPGAHVIGLEQALEQLPADDRLLLHMRIVDELPYAVIAGMLGIEPGAVGSRLDDARARLYSVLRRTVQDNALQADDTTAPVGFVNRMRDRLPGRRRDRVAFLRYVATAAAGVILLVVAVLAIRPTAPRDAGAFIRTDLLREDSAPAAARTRGMESMSLEQAQAETPWPIRQPRDLPEGFTLVAIEHGFAYDIARGPTVVLHYQSQAGASSELSLLQLQPTGTTQLVEPVAEGAATPVPVGNATGMFIDGQWLGPTWQRGTLARVVLETSGLLLQLQGDPRQGWDATHLAEVAASVH
jgi:RNA polymerase sigma factor (sigma-70 family)